MSEANLVLHAGAQMVSETELLGFLAPPPEGRWFPLSHSRVLDAVKTSLADVGYSVTKQQLGVFRDGSRFFGTLDLASHITGGVTLAVGIRNSVDKSFPLGFIAGTRVFVCDNLAFRSELLVRRRHTVNGERDFVRRIAQSVAQLHQFEVDEAQQIHVMKMREVSEIEADSIILRSYERGIITTQELPRVLREWRNPPFDEFKARNVWSLFNAYTSAIKDRAEKNPQAHAVTTMRIAGLFGPPYSLFTIHLKGPRRLWNRVTLCSAGCCSCSRW